MGQFPVLLMATPSAAVAGRQNKWINVVVFQFAWFLKADSNLNYTLPATGQRKLVSETGFVWKRYDCGIINKTSMMRLWIFFS